MATSDEVVSPYDRMMDVYSRRKKGNDINKPFFKVCFINSLNEMLYMITGNEQYHYILNVNDLDPVEIDRILKEVSDTFWETYNSVICKENIRSI